MKTKMLIAVAALSSTVWAASVDRKVIVCFDRTVTVAAADVADLAETIASKMFRDINVTLEWHDAGHFCRTHRNQVIAISLSTRNPRSLLPGALAYALPYEGVHIEVFYDRLTTRDGVEPSLLAHVLVHEITHILQGVSRHSASGIMMAHWDSDLCSRMKTKPLTFTAHDVELIYNGLAGRTAAAELLAAR